MNFMTIFNSIKDFFVNIPSFLNYFFDLVNSTLDIIPYPFSKIIKVLLTISTVIVIVQAIKNIK